MEIDPDNASATIEWDPGTATDNSGQRLYVGRDEDEVNDGCQGTDHGCAVKRAGLDSDLSSYTASGLDSGAVYYVKIVNYQNANCSYSDETKFLSSCPLSPASADIYVGSTQELDMQIGRLPSGSDQVNFSSGNAAVTVSPSFDRSYSYSTTATGVGVNPGVTITGEVIMGGDAVCSSTADFSVSDNSGTW